MIKFERSYLPVIKTEEELNTVTAGALKEALIEKPANVVYFETEKRVYGIVTYGDILASRGTSAKLAERKHGFLSEGPLEGSFEIKINRNFKSLTEHDYMKAREMFRDNDMLCEIPVLSEEGKLAGEYNRFDEILLLERQRDWKYNRYTSLFWKSMGSIALVRPGKARPKKQDLFEKWLREMRSYGADVTVIDPSDIARLHEEYKVFLFVDEQERRGAVMILAHMLGFMPDPEKLRTFMFMTEKMGASESVDYGEILDSFRDKGIKVITISLNGRGTEYEKRIQAECEARYPVVETELNTLMKPYDREFFDDLYSAEFASEMEEGYFTVEKTKALMRLKDTASKYINIKNGERTTAGQPEDYTQTIFFFGPCLMIGTYVPDEYTFESCLQKMINEKGYKVRVVNCGCWGGNISAVGRMASSVMREGDIAVALLEDYNMTGEDTLDLWDVLEANNVPSEWLLDNPFHCNHHVMRYYAEALFDKIFGGEYECPAEKQPFIVQKNNIIELFYTDKYFYGDEGPDPAGKTRGACVINGNPFTSGHRYLIETAASRVDELIVFVVQEDASLFSYPERYAMAYAGVEDIDNVTVVPSGLFFGNINIFPAYYARIYIGNMQEEARHHVDAFAGVAGILGISCRFVGEEPEDDITREINKAMKDVLPGYGIEPVEIKRKAVSGRNISGTEIRALAAEDKREELKELVPESTYRIIQGIDPD